MAFFIAIPFILKLFLKDAYYKHVLATLNLIYLLVLFPQPIHFFGLIVYSFFIIWILSDILKIEKRIFGIMLLILPLFLVKVDGSAFDWLSFAGLSYASFRFVGYYMDKAPDERIVDGITYFNFLSFTPTLLIGPIDRLNRFKASQNEGFSNLTSENFILGWNSFIKGLIFKYVCAELVDRYWLTLFPADSKELLHTVNSMYAYYFYLFFDFAGYSFMALGIGKMMGMVVPVNFTNPFLAQNPPDFWKRFHISLGDWLKDYFFTPLYLFLSRKKRLKQYPLVRQNTALFLTFLLMGCWNGFTTNFILSGALLGFYSVVYNTYSVQCKKKGRDIIFGKMNLKIVRVLSIFIMFNIIAVALYIFSGRIEL